jgi:hypothetical protein
MQNKKRAVLTLSLLLAIAIGLLVWRATALSLGECGDTVKSSVRSSQGFAAVVHLRNCGATTGYTTYVSIDVGESGAKTARDDRVLVLVGMCDVRAQWRGHDLLLSYPGSCEVFHEVTVWYGIKIQSIAT